MKFKINMMIMIIGVVSLLIMAGCSSSEPTKTTTSPQGQKESEPVQQETQPEEVSLDANCDAFPEKLDSCTKYKCQFTHPMTGETMEKEILGIIDGKCNYVEQMPNNGLMECKYTESMRKAAAKYYEDLASTESSGTSVKADLGSGEVETKYTIDGKEVANPLQEAMTNGQCVISGYE
jgi:PBP1b-binding outer membrane lipoprotein LpoB